MQLIRIHDIKNALLFLGILIFPVISRAQMTPYQVIEKMTCGINVGRSLELANEGDAGGRYIQEYYFADFKAAGFNFVRIPIQWDQHTGTSAPYKVDSAWLERVEQVIDWSLGNGLLTIINSHHDRWILENSNYTSNDLERFKAIWSQVSEKFKDKSDSLIFEIANEPNIAIEKTDLLNSSVIPVIRSSNPTRNIIFGGSGTQLSTLKKAVIPVDDFLIASFHTYEPWNFAGDGNGTWGTAGQVSAVRSLMEDAAAWSAEYNIPLLLGEFGTVNKCEANSRMKWFYTHLEEARLRNIATAVWQDFGDFSIYFHTTNVAKKWNDDMRDIIVHTHPLSANSLVVSVENATNAKLDWQNRASDYSWIWIERRLGTGKYERLDSLDGNALTYLDETTASGKTYTYRVVSKLSTGETVYSFPVTKKIEIPASTFDLKTGESGKRMKAYIVDDRLIIDTGSRNENANYYYSVYSLSGREIASGSFQADVYRVNVSEFSKGMYIIHIFTPDGLSVSRKAICH